MRILFLFLCLCSTPALAFYCGNQIVAKGDAAEDVLKKCGEPAKKNQWDEIGIRRVKTMVSVRPPAYKYVEGLVQLHYESWLYNFGPQALKQKVFFLNGVVEKISDEGYGTAP